MDLPSPQTQLDFLKNIQRLLSEGTFTATYKYALLLALADTCVELGEDTGAPFTIQTSRLAEKFITYYWRQAKPLHRRQQVSLTRQSFCHEEWRSSHVHRG